jgi:hypothetical protein
MADATSGAAPAPDDEAKCPHCGRKAHPSGKYPRSKAERRKALLRDANDRDSGLSQKARDFIIKHDGNYVPSGYEVSHEVPLYTLPKKDRCKLDFDGNMRTQRRSDHRRRHRAGGDQATMFPRSMFKF